MLSDCGCWQAILGSCNSLGAAVFLASAPLHFLQVRARDLFYGLWVNDLFMRRVEANAEWSLFCPNEAPGLAECWGEAFDALYQRFEREGRAKRTIKAQQLWFAILEAQVRIIILYISVSTFRFSLEFQISKSVVLLGLILPLQNVRLARNYGLPWQLAADPAQQSQLRVFCITELDVCPVGFTNRNHLHCICNCSVCIVAADTLLLVLSSRLVLLPPYMLGVDQSACLLFRLSAASAVYNV